MRKVCIYDFDGTIIDSMDEFADIAAGVLNKYFDTPAEEARAQYIKTSGLPFHDQIEILHPNDLKNPIAVNEYEETKKKTYLSKKPFDDVAPAIGQLRKRGIKTIISSNNFQNLVEELVDRVDIKFDMVLGWKENFSKGKDHFEHVKKTYGCSEKEIVFIGDSLKDADRATGNGIEFIGRTGTFNRNDFQKHCKNAKVIDSLIELEKIIS